MDLLKESVVILGAGLTGLITANKLLKDGFTDVTLLERHDAVGGVWAQGRRYPGLRSNNPRGSYRFSDFPFETDKFKDDVCLQGEEVQAALERFAKERVGMERITLNATVVSIEPIGKLSDFPSPKWTVTYQIAGDPEPKSKICTFLAVCAGLHSDPMPIKLPNQEVFQGLVVHSSELGDPGVYDKVLAADKVAVIGCSKSAADICSYLAGKRGTERPPVTMLSRQNRYFVEIKDKDKVPVLRKAFSWLAPHWRNPEDSYLHGTWLGSNIASTLRNVISKGMAKSIPEPIRPDVSLGVFQDSAIPVASQGLFDRLREGSIVVVHEPNMKLSFSGPKTLSLGEGKSSIDADVVIECTGWKPAFSYFSEDLKARLGLPHKGNPFRLWRGIAPVGVNGIAFNGFIRSLMNSLTSEVAAHWVSSLFQGFIPIPSVQEQNNEIDKIIEWQKQQFPTEHRSDLLGCIYMLHYVAYLEELLKDMGCRTNRSNSWFDAIAPYLPPLYEGLEKEKRREYVASL